MKPCAKVETMEIYHKTTGKHSTLVISTNSEIYKFLKSLDEEAPSPEP